MALPNTDPIYSRAGDIQSAGSVVGPTANTAADGTGTLIPVFQVDATNGGFVRNISFIPVGSPAQTVARIFISSITGTFTGNTSANTWLVGEVTLFAVTGSQIAAQAPVSYMLNAPLPAGYRVVIAFGTSTGSAGTGYSVVGFGGKY